MKAVSGSQAEITRLVAACADGEREAFDRLLAAVYDDFRAIAHRWLEREEDGHTLSTTALVHEAYLEMVDQARSGWENRAHFFAAASRVMRHVLVDHARKRQALRRGGGQTSLPLREELLAAPSRAVDPVDLIALDAALTWLSERSERMARVVECRWFGGMTAPETAQALGTSLRTVEREWTRAKAYLQRALEVDAEHPQESSP